MGLLDCLFRGIVLEATWFFILLELRVTGSSVVGYTLAYDVGASYAYNPLNGIGRNVEVLTEDRQNGR